MAKKDTDFDLEKVMRMEEPLTVYLERSRGGVQEPIPLPGLQHSGEIDPSQTPGTNWTKDTLTKMPTWIRDHWTGAGSYKCQVVDVKGSKHTFEFAFPHNLVPERLPQPFNSMRGIPSPAQVQVEQPPQPQPPQQQPFMVAPPPVLPPASLGQSNPYGLTFAGHPPSPPPQPQPPPPAAPTWQNQNGPPWQGTGFGGAQGFAPPPAVTQTLQPTRDAMEENRVLREKLGQLDRDKLELSHRQEIERLRLESQRALDEIRRSTESRRGDSDEVARAREEREKERGEREKMEREHSRQLLEAQIKATQDGLRATQEMMAKLAEKFSERQRPEEDDRIRALMEQNRQRDEEHRRDKEKWELERREDNARREQEKRDEQARRTQEEQQRRTELMFAEQARKHEELSRQLVAAANSGPDPMMEFFKETQRQQMEFQRQISEGHRATLEMQKQNAINPLELMRMLKESSSGSEALMTNMAKSMSGVVDMYRNAATEIVGMSGGGQSSWVPGMIEQGLGAGKDIMDRYFAFKAAEAKSAGGARVAEAQAQAIAAQSSVAQAQAALSNMRRPQAAAGLNGAPAEAPTPVAGVSAPATANGNGRVIPMRPSKPSDVELFTEQVLPHVETLRESVAAGKLSPLAAIRAIMTGINNVQAAKIEVPAFTLYAEKRWADFVDLLLPGTPQDYRDECVSILSKMEAHQHVEEDGEGEGDEEEEGEEDDDKPAS